MSSVFWFVAGVLSGVTATLVAVPLWRTSSGPTARAGSLRWLGAVAGIGGMVAIAAAVYLAVGSPRSLDEAATKMPSAAHPGVAPNGGNVPSMEAATARLEARLKESGGSAQDWQLLAESYEFLGRTEDAQRARASGLNASSPQPGAITGATLTAARSILPEATPAAPAETPPASATALPLKDLEERVKSNPKDAAAWLDLADAHRGRREFGAARSAFQKVIALHAMTAQSWADYADVVGSASGGTLNAEAAKAIDESLALDPVNAKALWLQATRAYQQRRYADALQLWRHLKSVLPAGSPDIPLVDANIAEATQLAGVAEAGAPAGPAASEVAGTVSIAEQFAPRVARGAVVFIYAKAVDSPGPPLAVVRLSAGSWPISFRLDDSMAMMPSRRLSQFRKVIVEARISRTGQAAPEPGDLYVTSDVISPGPGKKLALVINREIG